MNRPIYETDEDRVNEKRMLRLAYPDRQAFKLPRSYHADFWLPHSELPPVIVECKQRSAYFGEYDTYAISLGKYMACMRLAEMMGGFFHIVTSWSDGIVAVAQMVTERTCHHPIKPGGRYDRNDPADVEPMVHIPIGAFKPIKSS